MAADEPRRTKIVATIGPASSSRDTICALIDAGVDAARLNFSHGTRDEHAARARFVRQAQEECGRPIALIADLQGPKLRIGDLPGVVTLLRGDDVIVAGDGAGGSGELPILPAVIGEVLEPGNDVLI